MYGPSAGTKAVLVERWAIVEVRLCYDITDLIAFTQLNFSSTSSSHSRSSVC